VDDPPVAEPPRGGTGATPAPSAPPSRWTRVHTVTDRIPTGWFASILTAIFLGVTAAFGGLAAVAAPPVAELQLGDTHENDQFAITIDRATLIDELPEAGVSVEPGQRVLAVVLTAENLWDRAQAAGGTTGIAGAVQVAGLGAPDSVARFDDATIGPYLQPNVPAELVLTWAVDADAYAEGDELRVDLRDFTLHRGQLVTYGEGWADPVTVAHLDAEIEDVGAGATPDDTAEGSEG
jgi:hypothetical protein